jgi:methylmalonyl-CoA mutase cobalamin-binding subunit
MVGGLVHPEDADALAALGVEATFGSASGLDEVVAFLDERADRRVSA